MTENQTLNKLPRWLRQNFARKQTDMSHELETTGLRVGGKARSARRWLPTIIIVCSAILCFGFALKFWHNVLLGHDRDQVQPPSNFTKLQPQYFPSQKSERVKIRYGPFSVPPMSVNNGMKEFGEPSALMPCENCLITWIQAGLEYPDGNVANADTGLWLHHTVWSNIRAESIICGWRGDRFFASGNERTPVNLCVDGTERVGYYVPPNPNFGYSAELMNMRDTVQEAMLTMTYEFIPNIPADFEHVNSLWLDIGGCKSSEMPAFSNTQFEYSSPSWRSNVTGRIVFTAGHLHDGGTHLLIKKNSQTLCDSRASYGDTYNAINPRIMGLEERHETKHITAMSDCSNVGLIEVGDDLDLTAYYDTKKWAPMQNMDGSLEPVMGIALVYVA